MYMNSYNDLFVSDADPLGCTAVVKYAVNTEKLPIYQPSLCIANPLLY